VIVDLAAERGGNCQLTKPGEIIRHHGVTIIGITDMPARMPALSSKLLGNVHAAMLEEMGGGEHFTIDLENEVVRGALIAHGGEVMWPPPVPKAPSTEKSYAKDFGERPKAATGTKPEAAAEPAAKGGALTVVCLIAVAALLLCIGLWAPASVAGHFTVFVLACFVGWQLVWNVTAALHTPLMSITNAVSGIIILGGLLHLNTGGATAADTGSTHTTAVILGALAVFFATINIAGGFLVTRRMLAMFRK
jgi:NAD(P) transhydrogenase subunit alpha